MCGNILSITRNSSLLFLYAWSFEDAAELGPDLSIALSMFLVDTSQGPLIHPTVVEFVVSLQHLLRGMTDQESSLCSSLIRKARKNSSANGLGISSC